MRYLFDHLGTIRDMLARSPLGLATDVDGTISEIAPLPERAQITPACREQLAILTSHLALVAAISGRPALVVRDMIGIEGIVYVGNHGLERWQDGALVFEPGAEVYREKVPALCAELEALADVEGIILEDKGISLAIHYRRCPDQEGARRHILEAVARAGTAGDFRTIEGKRMVELRPPIDADKGTAVRALIERYGLRGGIYLGDDLTDVDAFAAMHAQGPAFKGIAIAVTGGETAAAVEESADLVCKGVGDVERFLRWLAETAPGPGH